MTRQQSTSNMPQRILVNTVVPPNTITDFIGMLQENYGLNYGCEGLLRGLQITDAREPGTRQKSRFPAVQFCIHDKTYWVQYHNGRGSNAGRLELLSSTDTHEPFLSSKISSFLKPRPYGVYEISWYISDQALKHQDHTREHSVIQENAEAINSLLPQFRQRLQELNFSEEHTRHPEYNTIRILKFDMIFLILKDIISQPQPSNLDQYEENHPPSYEEIQRMPQDEAESDTPSSEIQQNPERRSHIRLQNNIAVTEI